MFRLIFTVFFRIIYALLQKNICKILTEYLFRLTNIKLSDKRFFTLADVAQLVRALVCGTRCREFESHLPPHSIFYPSFSRGIFFICGRR